MNPRYDIPTLPLGYDFETKPVLRQANAANRQLAELKGIAHTIPNEKILLSTLILQEALESSAVENIVSSSDELYMAELNLEGHLQNASAKEVLLYREAMNEGFNRARIHKLLTINDIVAMQRVLEQNNAGFRKTPGTMLKSSAGDVVYTPPQTYEEIMLHMQNLEQYINNHSAHDVAPLIKLAIIHHQFESIPPFYDGNGRTGRIISVLYLVINDLLDLPILYLSRYIKRNKTEYYKFIQDIRDSHGDNFEEWERWILFILKGIEQTATQTISLVKQISVLMAKFKSILRPLFGQQYKHELLNNLFFHPYTKIEFLQRDLLIQRKTAAKYLDKIVDAGLLEKHKLGRSNYYINTALRGLFLLHDSLPFDTPSSAGQDF